MLPQKSGTSSSAAVGSMIISFVFLSTMQDMAVAIYFMGIPASKRASEMALTAAANTYAYIQVRAYLVLWDIHVNIHSQNHHL